MLKNKNSKEVIIAYEGIVREYDNALLLKAALEKKGYRVSLVYKTDTFLLRKHNAICILPNGYTTENIDYYRYILNANGNELINLQYEQVFSKKIVDLKVHIPKGKAKNMWLICWGENAKRRLVDHGINPANIRVCGAMQLDMMMPNFADFYQSRDLISKKFHIDISKKWLLYISSFTYVNNDKLLDDARPEFNDDEYIDEFAKVSTRSQISTMEYFERLVAEHNDIVVVYRPHPVEAENEVIQEIAKKYPDNFFCISELGIKQWISVSDVISTWISTTAAEVYVAKKPLLVIRPYSVPKEYDIPYYINADCVDSYEKLVNSIYHESEYGVLSISKELLFDYYSIEDKPAYERIADIVDEVYEKQVNQREKYFFFKRMQFAIKGGFIFKLAIKKIYQQLYIKFGMKIKNRRFREKYYVNDWEHSILHRTSNITKEKNDTIKRKVSE